MFFKFLFKAKIVFALCSVIVLGSPYLPDHDVESLEVNGQNNNIFMVQNLPRQEVSVAANDRFSNVDAGFADNASLQTSQRIALAKRILHKAGEFTCKVVRNVVIGLTVLTLLKLMGIDVMRAFQGKCD